MTDHDFGGYATRAGVKCTDGRTITPDAFKHQDNMQVPLIWQHLHEEPQNVLGHANLEHKADGIYAYCFLNDTDAGKAAGTLIKHKDIRFLSIFANGLVEKKKTVLHGDIREVSLVLAGANPGAQIDYVRVAHSDGEVVEADDAAIIYTDFEIELAHADSATDKKTYQDVYDSLNDDQRALVEFMLSEALGSAKHSATDEDKVENDDNENDDNEKSGDGSEDKTLEHKEKDTTMTRNVFETDSNKNSGSGDALRDGQPHLNHSQMATILATAKKVGSFKEAVLVHAEDYGITNIEVLFPDAVAIDNKPEWITRKMAWVEGVLNGTRKLPFAKIKSLSADLTHDEARAKGYIKGTMKKDQFFAVAKRETGPKTIYKKQKLDRDDIIDATEFDVVAWLWVEMRFMLREEVARAILVSDGREIDDEDKISETSIRPIAFDDEFYTDVINVPANVGSSDLIEAVLRGRNNYKGTSPTAYMTNAVMVDMLLSKDKLGRRYYSTKADLAAALMVQEIVEVPVMEDLQRDGAEVLMIIVNLSDYAVGSTRGGEITTFDDFDIDYNQYKYLIETRLSGALTKHKSAQIILRGSGTLVTPTVPTFNSGTGVVTIPTVTGVTYKNQETLVTLSAGAQTALDPGEELSVVAVPNAGYYFPHNHDADWNFLRPV
jgi:HK97 family phage prohead protease